MAATCLSISRTALPRRIELFYLDLGDPLKPSISGTPRPLYTRNDAEYIVIGHADRTIFLQTTLDAPKRRLVAASVGQPDSAHWRVLVPEGEGVMHGAGMAGRALLVDYEVVAKSRLALFSTEGTPQGNCPCRPSARSAGSPHAMIPMRSITALSRSSTPSRFPAMTSSSAAIMCSSSPRSASTVPYDLKQVFYPSKDGTKIPMFIVGKRDVKLNGNNPTILYGYGGFDITITPRFNPMLPVWLELGGGLCRRQSAGWRHLRRGLARGRDAWPQAECIRRFAWGAKYLIAEKLHRPRRLGIQGYSNGGLLVGASITQHPELFGAGLCRRRRPGYAPLPRF